jgi:hypothetical protein
MRTLFVWIAVWELYITRSASGHFPSFVVVSSPGELSNHAAICRAGYRNTNGLRATDARRDGLATQRLLHSFFATA